MSKTRDTGFLANVIQVHDTGVRIMSGSEMLMAISSSGAVTITGELSGSDAANSLLLGGTGSVGFTTTGSFNTASGSLSSRTSQIEAVYATTGSNSFRATQSITGSLTVTGQIIAQTLNVQQVTSSIVYSSGSNVFGCDINSRQTFTGSFYQTGSVACFSNCLIVGGGANFVSSVTATRLSLNNIGTAARLQVNGVNSEPIAYLYNNSGTAGSVQGVSIEAGTNSSDYALSVASSLGTSRLYIRGDGNIGIATTCPTATLQIGDGSANSFLRIRAADGGAIVFNKGADNSAFIGEVQAGLGSCNGLLLYTYSGAERPIIFYTAGTEKMRITGGGYVGMGTTGPTEILHLNSPSSNAAFIRFEGTGGGGVYIGNRSDNMELYAGGSERMRITSTGIACFSCQICTPILRATETRLGNSYTCTFPVACVGGQYATVVPPGTLATTEVYLAHIYYDNGSAPPYTANTAFIFKTALVNGGGVDNAVFPATTTHQGGTGCWSFRSVASSPHQSSGLQVQAHSFANNISTATIYLVRLT
jgi:hypothetical protein